MAPCVARKRRCVNPERVSPAATRRAGFSRVVRRGIAAVAQQDSSRAFRRFRRAAETGDAEAQYWLGLLYARGEGVLASLCDAMVWFQRAAEQGHADAQYQLSLAYL